MTAGVAPNVLLSSAGRRAGLLAAFRESLAQLDIDGAVLATDASRLSAAAHLADAAFVVPRCDDPAFVPAVLDLCRTHDVGLVVPTIDPELPIYAAARGRFADEGIEVAVSAPEVVAVSADKRRTHEWLTSKGFPTVRQASPAEVRAHEEAWPFPLVVKPRFGSASAGVVTVRSPEELDVADRPDQDLVVQSVAAGHEYTIDVLAGLDGGFRCAVPRRRLEVRAGEVSKGVTARVPEIMELARSITAELGEVRGPLTIQLFRDPRTGDVAVIELNARFGGGFPLSWEAGALYPRWILEDLHGLPSTARPDLWADGIVMLRYDDAVFVKAEECGL